MSGTVSSNSTSSVVAAEQRAREWLDSKQWRKARDELKPLVKLDRPRFLPLLILANIGLSREMLAKGQVAEAHQVLSYLASIASSEQLRAIELELDSRWDPASSDLHKLANALVDANARLTEAERLKLTDQLVLSFQTLALDDAAHARAAAELRGIHDALLAASLQQWDRVAESLRPISHRSNFAHWSVFIKGLAAFHGGDMERALRLLTSLPSQTVPAKASHAYLLVARQRVSVQDAGAINATVLEGVCRLLGQPGLGHLLLRAERLWKEGRHVESYRIFHDSVAGFPTQNLDFLGALTEFYFNVALTLPEADQEKYLDYLDELLARGAAKNGVEEMLAYRLFALVRSDRFDWERFLQLHERIFKPNPRFASIVYGHLSERLIRSEPTSYFFGPRRQPPGQQEAIECLRKAISLDPNNLEAHLKLVGIYTHLKKQSDRNRLLDRMVERFPEEGRVLLDAAAGCIDRRAYVKGLDYLDRARRLDQLDPRIPGSITVARCRLAEQYFQQNRLDKARQNLALVQEFLTDKPDDFQRSRWVVWLRHGLMEQLWGDGPQAQVLLDQARAASPFPGAYLLFAHLAYRSYVLEARTETPFWPDLAAALTSSPNLGWTVFLLLMLEYWKRASDSGGFKAEDRLVRKGFKAASQKPFTRDEARQLAELKLADPGWRGELMVVIKKVLRGDSLDPLFRLYRILAQREIERRPSSCRPKLEVILQEAARRGDDPTVQRIRQLLKRLEASARRPLPPFPDLEIDEEDEDDDFDTPPEFEGRFPDLPPAIAAQMRQIMELLSRMPNSELENARQTRPKGFPVEVFDMLVELAKSGELPPPPPPMPPGRQPTRSGADSEESAPDEDDPNQLSLL